jgi:hypothetical protein
MAVYLHGILICTMKRKLGEFHNMLGRAVNGKLSLLLPEITMIVQPLSKFRTMD